jgi:hypothetical protein
MNDWTGLATLVAAVAAALLSGISLFLSGRREDKRWKREVLQETMVSLFDASFGSLDQSDLEARKAGDDLDWHKERALDAHAAQLRALTRLRFLARPKVVARAFELHHIEDNLYSTLFNKPLDMAEWARLTEKRRVARNKLFNACRRNLGLWRALPIRPFGYTGPSPQEMADHEMRRQRSAEPHPASISTYRSS